MFNQELFEEHIKKAGLRKAEVAKLMNIEESTLYRKAKNGYFTISDINLLEKILKLKKKEREAIFFAK